MGGNMIIAKSDIQLQSEHTLTESSQISKREVRETGILFNAQFTQAASKLVKAEAVEEPVTVQDTKTRLFNVLFAAITGKQYSAQSTENLCACTASQEPSGGWESGRIQRSAATAGLGGMAWKSIEVSISQRYERIETTGFAAAGRIETDDGQILDMDLSLVMHNQQSYQSDTYTKQTVVFKDPLVLSFDGRSAELSDSSFLFDLDQDGVVDLMPYLVEGSGWLAYDRNNDGIINDGSELFGVTSGNGFEDLSAYDDDNNGFIDEADKVFESLQIWTKSEDSDQLFSLAEQDVGAIGLASSNTPFMQYQGDGSIVGAVRETGFYLKESGGAGLMQQIDIASDVLSDEGVA